MPHPSRGHNEKRFLIVVVTHVAPSFSNAAAIEAPLLLSELYVGSLGWNGRSIAAGFEASVDYFPFISESKLDETVTANANVDTGFDETVTTDVDTGLDETVTADVDTGLDKTVTGEDFLLLNISATFCECLAAARFNSFLPIINTSQIK